MSYWVVSESWYVSCLHNHYFHFSCNTRAQTQLWMHTCTSTAVHAHLHTHSCACTLAHALGAIAKVRRSPAKRTKLVSFETPSLPSETNKSSHFRLQLSDQCVYKTPFETPSLPLKRTKVRTSGFNSQTNVYTKHHLKLKVRFFFFKPPPSQTNFARFVGLLRTFVTAPYRKVFVILVVLINCQRQESCWREMFHLLGLVHLRSSCDWPSQVQFCRCY